MREPAHRGGDLVHRPAAHHVADVVAQLLETQGAFHHLGVTLHQRDDATHTEEVGGHQEVGVQDVALDGLAMQEQTPEQHGLVGARDTEGVLQGGDGREHMAVGADAADARRDQRCLLVGPAPQHPFEETRRFRDLEPHLLDLVALSDDHDVAVALHSGHIVDVHTDGDGLTHGAPPSL